MLKRIVTVLIVLFMLGTSVVPTKTMASEHITLFTPFTGLSVTPGETIDYSVTVMNDSSQIENVAFEINNLPEGWEHTITASGRDIRQLSIKPNSEEDIDLEISVPLEVEKADYHFVLVARSNGTTLTTLPFLTTVSEQGTFETELSSEQPNLEGHADSTFSYSLDLKNRTADTQNYALNSGAPDGWGVQFQAGSKNVTSVSLEPNESKSITVDVTPPQNIKAGTYEIPIQAATGSTSADTTLEAVITGSYEIKISTPSGRLSTDITAGNDKTIDLVVENTGTAKLSSIDITASTPPNWESEFDMSTIPELEAGASKTIKATLTAPDDAIAGDYVTTFTAETAEASSDAAFRVSVETSTFWGFIGVFIILAVVGGLYYLIRKYGRR
ncbi:NEW3 domain-containing protein [Aquibacillus albus]|uniref:Membrane protein n=1 Tax=Aquibacillus albus TaxID=1168171 RepID=A0ABS2N2R7_9BACI|nr:NEW3 domain-containing protein [Aquibacillus albus]MBM7572403.1 putative membrane protein [Aquibacillus albus]